MTTKNVILTAAGGYSAPVGSTYAPAQLRGFLESPTICGSKTFAGSQRIFAGSTIGQNWTEVYLTPDSIIYDYAVNGSTIVGVGIGGSVLTGVVVRSTDGGTTWSKITTTTAGLFTVTFFNSLFIAGGYDGKVYSSPDGVTWTQRLSDPGVNINVSGASSTKIIVAAPPNRYYTSTDGITWSNLFFSPFLGDPTDVVWTGSLFVMVGYTSSNGLILTSPDGITWTQRLSVASGFFSSVAWSGSLLVATGSGVVATSPDGVTWTIVASGTGTGYTQVTWLTSRFLATNNSVIYYSTNGSTWVLESSNAPGSIGRPYTTINWVNGNYLASTHNGTTRVATVYSSPDAVKWDLKSTFTGYATDYLTDGSVTVAVAYRQSSSTNYIYTSTDLLTWTLRYSGSSGDLNSGVYANSLFVAVGNSGVILTSPDGITWTAQTSGTSNSLNKIIYSNGQFVVVGTSGTILTSSDGVTWTSRTSGTVNSITGIAWSGSTYCATASTDILRSTDGVTWTVSPAPSGITLRSIIWIGQQFVAVYDPFGQTQIWTSPTGTTWTKTDEFYEGTIVVGTNGSEVLIAGDSGNVFVSPEPLTASF